jgi:probable rRNA maturation factor
MIEINNTTKTPVNEKLVKDIAEKTLKYCKKSSYGISIAFVGEVAMRRLNKQSRGYDKVTDILSFEGEGKDLGELILCNNQIIKQAPRYQQTAEKELVFILVHGILHLLGFTDEIETDRLAMIKEGEKIIKKISPKHSPQVSGVRY